MSDINHTTIQCDDALSDLILLAAQQAAQQAISAHDELQPCLPNCSVRNQPLLPLLKGLLDATLVTAMAVADNAWDESRPMDPALMTDLARQARLIASVMESAANCPDSQK